MQKNHVIYISKRKDSSMSNNEKNQNEINKYNNYSSQTMTVTKLSRNNINQKKDLYKQIIIPQKRLSSIVNSIGDIKQNNNINIYTNYTNNSNTFRNVNIKTTALKNYNYLTHNVRKNKIDNETKQRNNKMFFNNTLTTVTEIKNDNLISHKINRKDLENLKNKNTVNVYNSSKGEKFFINPRKHNSFISEIPKNPYARYGSKDSIFEKINISKNTNIITITNINNNSNNQNANNLIKIPHSFNKNIIYNNSNNNITKISQNTIYPENKEKNKINVNIINSINNQTLKNLGDRNNWKNINSILHKTNIRDIINKSMDNKEIKTPKIDNKNIVFIRKEFSLKYKNKERENKEYINEKIKEEKEEDSSNKSIKEEDEIKHEKKQKKKRKLKQEDDNGNKILFINRRLVSDISNHSSNKDIISNVKTEIGQKKHKEPLDSIRKVKGKKIQKKLLVHKKHQKKEELNNIKIENINNINENKMENNKINDNIIINDIQYEIKIISKLKCSSIYRQFLLNILNIFEEENVFIYNYMLESYIFSDIIKIDTRLLFQKTRAKEKIIFSYTDILEKIRQKETIQSIFNTFYNENKSIFIQPVINIGFFGNLFNKKIPTSIKSGKGFEIYYNLNELKLMPIIRGEIYSTQITIVIDGPLSTDIQLISNDTTLSHKEIFSSFFTNNIYTNSDFYLYDWQSINYKEIKRIKKVSKFYGKLLAYIITSREVFSFQTINLVGYSMGCNVIKYCLLELNKINKKINCFDIINTVIFIGGSINIKMNKYPDIFEGIAGKVVNIFSKVDTTLIEYNKTAIGLKEIETPKEFVNKYHIINYDLSKKNIKQDDYLYQIPNILFENTYLH